MWWQALDEELDGRTCIFHPQQRSTICQCEGGVCVCVCEVCVCVSISEQLTSLLINQPFHA